MFGLPKRKKDISVCKRPEQVRDERWTQTSECDGGRGRAKKIIREKRDSSAEFKNAKNRGARVEIMTLDFGSDHDPRVVGSNPCWALC